MTDRVKLDAPTAQNDTAEPGSPAHLSEQDAGAEIPQREVSDGQQELVVELPDHRLVAIHSLDPTDEDDSLVSDLIETNPAFRDLLNRSKVAPRKPFPKTG